MLNYGILQNEHISLPEVEGEAFFIDLAFCEEMGEEASKKGNETEALQWFTRGLEMAHQLKKDDKIEYFSNLIFTCF